MAAHKLPVVGFMTGPDFDRTTTTRNMVSGRMECAPAPANTCLNGPRNRTPTELTFGGAAQTLEEIRAELEGYSSRR